MALVKSEIEISLYPFLLWTTMPDSFVRVEAQGFHSTGTTAFFNPRLSSRVSRQMKGNNYNVKRTCRTSGWKEWNPVEFLAAAWQWHAQYQACSSIHVILFILKIQTPIDFSLWYKYCTFLTLTISPTWWKELQKCQQNCWQHGCQATIAGGYIYIQSNRDRAQLSPACTGGESDSSLRIDFVLHKGASLSIPSASKQQKND